MMGPGNLMFPMFAFSRAETVLPSLVWSLATKVHTLGNVQNPNEVGGGSQLASQATPGFGELVLNRERTGSVS